VRLRSDCLAAHSPKGQFTTHLGKSVNQDD
jgi:hypothetical protein